MRNRKQETKDTKARRDGRKTRRGKGYSCSREELLLEAETIGMDALGWIHGGADATAGCCVWGAKTKCNRCRPQNCQGGTYPPTPPSNPPGK
jgi:hypothetical protein